MSSRSRVPRLVAGILSGVGLFGLGTSVSAFEGGTIEQVVARLRRPQPEACLAISRVEGLATDALLTAVRFDAKRRIGIAVGGQRGDDPGTIVRTNDGGDVWTSVSGAESVRLYDVAHVSGRVFVAVGLGGRILRSEDGGATWTRVRTGGEWLAGVAFFSPKSGIAVGHDEGRAVILRTSDGGGTWGPGPEVPAGCTEASLRAIRARDSRVGVIVGTSGALLVTDDGGVSWRSIDVGDGYLRGIAFAGDRIWVCGGPGTLVGSVDSGKTWRRAEFPTEDKLNAAGFLTEDVGWVTSMEGRLYQTTDGGQSWRAIHETEQIHLTGVVVPTVDGDGFVVGGNGLMLRLALRREPLIEVAMSRFDEDGGRAVFRLEAAGIRPSEGREAVSFYYYGTCGAIALGEPSAARRLLGEFESAARTIPAITESRRARLITELRQRITALER